MKIAGIRTKAKGMIMAWCVVVATAACCRASAKPVAIDALLEAGRFDEAQAVVEAEKSSAAKSFLQSKVAFYRGDYAEAVREIATAIAADGSREDYKNIRRYYYALEALQGTARELESEHFRLRAGGSDVLLSRYALDCLEKAYRELGDDLGCHPGGKILVEVYSLKEDFSLGSTLSEEVLEKSGTVGICKFNRIMILSPQATPLGYTWLDTLAHEYAHFLVNRAGGGECPLWLHEGIARYHDTRWRSKEPLYLTADTENRLLEARKKRSFVPFEKMHPSIVYLKDQDEMALAFAEVSAAVGFMKREHGSDIVALLLKDMSSAGFDGAFKRTLGVNARGFEKKFYQYLNELSLKESHGVMGDQVKFNNVPEDEFIGADQRGLVRLGDRMRQAGRMDAALLQYEKALSAEPHNPVILLKIARAGLDMGDDERARRCLEQAIEKNPGYVTPYQALGELLCRKQDYRQAEAVLKQSIAINPFHADSHRMLARCYFAANDRENAVYELDVVRCLDPSDIETKIILERLGK